MDILERIERYIMDVGKHPWAFGCNVNEISEKSLIAWHLLSVLERLAISKDNPFIPERKEILLKLRHQGFSQSVLSDLSGLAPVTIKRLSPKKKAKHE